MRCEACSSNASTVGGFATSSSWNSVSSRSGVGSTRTSLTKQFDSGVFDYTRICPCKRQPLWAQTVTNVIVYESLRVPFLANVNSLSRSLYAITVPSLCLSSVCNVHAPYSASWNFRQYFFAIWYLFHPLTIAENFTETVQEEPLRRRV